MGDSEEATGTVESVDIKGHYMKQPRKATRWPRWTSLCRCYPYGDSTYNNLAQARRLGGIIVGNRPVHVLLIRVANPGFMRVLCEPRAPPRGE